MVRQRNGANDGQAPGVNEAAQVVLHALAANMGYAPVGQRDEIADVVERFRRQRPPIFSGSANPIQADNWIRETELAFELMTCSETQKVICATHMLRDNTMHWWDSTKRAHTTVENPMTWTRFKELFNDKYFPLSIRSAKEAEFLHLKQNNLSLLEYERKFEELCRYAPRQVSNEWEKARRFEDGLNDEVFNTVAGIRLQTYSEVLQSAQIIANKRARKKVSNESLNFGSKSLDHNNIKRKFEENNFESKKSKIEEVGREFPNCITCGKKYGGECYWKTGACFNCGKIRHPVKDCPDFKKDDTRTRGRVYAMTRKQEEVDPSLVSGTLLVSNHDD